MLYPVSVFLERIYHEGSRQHQNLKQLLEKNKWFTTNCQHAFDGSKYGSMTHVAPHDNGVTIALMLPWTWCSGKTWSRTSLASQDHRSIMPMSCAWILPKVWTTPYKQIWHRLLWMCMQQIAFFVIPQHPIFLNPNSQQIKSTTFFKTHLFVGCVIENSKSK